MSIKGLIFINKQKLLRFVLTPVVFVAVWLVTIFIAVYAVIGNPFSYLNTLFGSSPPVFTPQTFDLFEPSENTLSSINLSDIDFPVYGHAFGTIKIESANINCNLYYGDNNQILLKGAGMYIGSHIPGYGGECIVCAHNDMHFKTLKLANIGDIINVTTTYGVYQYKISDMQVKAVNDATAYDLTANSQTFVLYTCRPANTPIGNINERLFVYSELISGPIIQKN